MFGLLFFLKNAASSGLLLILHKRTMKKAFLVASFLFSPINSFLYLFCKKDLNICSAVENLGIIFIKFGQALSTRGDLIGDDIAASLKSLQDNLKPFSSKIAISIFESEFKLKISDIFSEFGTEPVAAASIAQVHRARMKNGKEVAVKILRPNIRENYRKDIELLYKIAYICKKFIKIFSNIKLVEAIKIFEKSMNQELDLKSEAANSSAMQAMIQIEDNIIIPSVIWDYTSSNILTTEWVQGVSIYDVNSEIIQNLDKEKILRIIAVSFFNQAFQNGFFHADLHPGNILVTDNGKVALLDFGIVGFLSEKDRIGLAEVLYSLLKRDYYRVAEIHQEIGFIPAHTNLYEFAIACRAVAEPIVGKSPNKLSVGHLLESLVKMTSEFSMETQPQLILLQKNIVILEGLGQILAPTINMWSLADPWITKWAKRNLGFDAKILRITKKFVQNFVGVVK
jgi:ubiquinone biosynthesis protein